MQPQQQSHHNLRPRRPTRQDDDTSDPSPLKESPATSENLGNNDHPPVEKFQSVEVQTADFEVPVIDMDDFERVGMNNKLNLLMAAINKVNTNFHLKIRECNERLHQCDSQITTKNSHTGESK